MLLLVACGPSNQGGDEGKLRSTTVDVARTYKADGDIAKARAAVDGLKVANPKQWLVMLTEQTIAENQDAEAAAALAKLAVDLDMDSASVLAYATQQGLVTPMAEPVLDSAPAVLTLSGSAPLATAAPAQVADVPAPGAALAGTPAVATETELSATVAATETPAAPAQPMAIAGSTINVRGGPGVDYGLVGVLQSQEQAAIVAKNQSSDWWEVTMPGGGTGWVLGQLVQTNGDVSAVSVASDIPTPPPAAATTDPIADATAPSVATDAPAATDTPAATPTTDPNAKPYYKLVQRRMWNKSENGDCRGQHLLRINVIDANGIRLNGVRLKGIYTGEVMVTGSQGKGDGVIEYDLYSTGEGFTVIQNDDGREVDSDRAEGFTTQSRDIDKPTLIAGGYCTNDADCQVFYDSWGCNGHHSWEATFQRNY